ncbi:hypothetical protein C2G38_2159563 [Gigaspora rosea]|uniref:Uncharacterized protein n=1 Tax=Gigaspora rosea TaxID=44941 RepID=A0A397W8W4_9GLOM|nr:hypothetical protein C2G38_2159563 [Gigaspora rosea]
MGLNKSLNELKVQFDREVRDAKRVYVSDSYIYIDIEANNVIIHPNTPPAGEGVFIRDFKNPAKIIGKTCSLESNFPISLYLRNWDTGNPNHLNKGLAQWTSHSFDLLPAIRNTDDPEHPDLFIDDARPATIHAIYLNENSSSEELRRVDLFGIQVSSGSKLTAALPSNIILEISNLVLHKI